MVGLWMMLIQLEFYQTRIEQVDGVTWGIFHKL
jgi:hypothetical protein